MYMQNENNDYETEDGTDLVAVLASPHDRTPPASPASQNSIISLCYTIQAHNDITLYTFARSLLV